MYNLGFLSLGFIATMVTHVILVACEQVSTFDKGTGKQVRRETNTMPQWAGSCWYAASESLPFGVTVNEKGDTEFRIP